MDDARASKRQWLDSPHEDKDREVASNTWIKALSMPILGLRRIRSSSCKRKVSSVKCLREYLHGCPTLHRLAHVVCNRS